MFRRFFRLSVYGLACFQGCVVQSFATDILTEDILKSPIVRVHQREEHFIKELLKKLQQNTNVTKLDLSANRIGEMLSQDVADLLEANSTLTVLDLHANDLNDKAIKKISQALGKNKALKKLNLDQNQFGNQGLKFLKNIITREERLNKLVITGNSSLKSQHIKELFTALPPTCDFRIKCDEKLLIEAVTKDNWIPGDSSSGPHKTYGLLQHMIGGIYEQGRGDVAFQTEKDWRQALTQAKFFYERAYKSGISEALKDCEKVEKKIATLKHIGGYVLNKIQNLKAIYSEKQPDRSELPFNPSHPFFQDISFISEMTSRYAPRLKEDMVNLIQRLLSCSDQKQTKAIIEMLKDFSSTHVFHKMAQKLDVQDQEGGEDQESKTADQELQRWFKKLEDGAASEKESNRLLEEINSMEKISSNQLSLGMDYVSRKLQEYQSKEARASFGPHHPLFQGISEFMAELSSCPPGVREAGIYLSQRALEFEEGSKLSVLLLEHLKELAASESFQAKALPGDELAENQAEKLLRSWGKAIEVTAHPSHLLRIEEVPQNVKVNNFFISDPRIDLYNLIFREDQRPVDLVEFKGAVDRLLGLFKKGIDEKKITDDMRYNSDVQAPGTIEQLRDLLTNTKGSQKDYSNLKISDRFGNRMVKIAQILTDKKRDQDLTYAVLGSWAAAGWHCDVRSEDETYKFYIRSLQDNLQLLPVDNTLEMQVALVLADLRQQFFQKLIPQDENERIHQEKYLENKLKKSLGLMGDVEQFTDPYQDKVLNGVYKRMSIEAFKSLVLKGNTNDVKYSYVTKKKRKQNYTVPISKAQGYANPQILIDHVLKGMNDKANPKINSSVLSDRFKLYNEPEMMERMSQYYDEGLTIITSEGVKALLFSLGYLEKAS